MGKDLSKIQLISNNIDYKQDFTINLSKSENRYIVSIKNLYIGTNPSIDFELTGRVRDIISSGQFDSIGGWTNIDGEYYVDANIHLKRLEFAVTVAKKNNQIAVYDSFEKKLIFI